jgi:lauroyl/myristoyl acyltransferase
MRTWVTMRDCPRILSLLCGFVATAVVPRRLDGSITDILSVICITFDRRRIRRVARTIERRLGPNLNGRDPVAIARDHFRMRIEDGWGRLRGLHCGGWQPRIEVEGIEHVRHALSAGSGVVLWTTLFCGAVIPKAAMWNAGIPMNHLSRTEHGAPSRSVLGLEILAPLYVRPETRYLKRRILVPLDESLGYMRDLIAVLAAGECLSITGELSGRQSVSVPFLNGTKAFATGAPALVWTCSSALLIVHVFRAGPMAYRVVITPIELTRDRARREFVRAAIGEYARQIELAIIRHPADWQGWLQLAAEESG